MKPLPIAVVCLACLAAGWIAGRSGKSNGSGDEKSRRGQGLSSWISSDGAGGGGSSPAAGGSGQTGGSARGKGAANGGSDCQAILETLRGMSSYQQRRELSRYVDSLPQGRVRELAREYAGLSWSGRAAGNLAETLAERWAELDPQSLREFVTDPANRDLPSLRTLERSYWAAAARADPGAALAEADRLTNEKDRRDARERVLSTLAQTDPEKALEIARQENGPGRSWLAARALEELAAWEPEKALALFHNTPAADREYAADDLALILARSDFPSALQFVSALPTAREKAQALSGLIQSGAWKSPGEIQGLLDTLPAGMRRETQQQFIQAWAGRDATAALEWVRNLPSENGRDRALVDFFSRPLSAELTNTALKMAESESPGTRRGIYSQLLSGAAGDAAAVEKLASAMPEGAERDLALLETIGNMGQREMESALRLAGMVGAFGRRTEVAGQLARNLAQSDPDKAIQWASALGEPRARKEALSAALGAWAEKDPTAAGLAALQQRDADLRRPLLVSVGAAWARSDPAAFLQWSRALPADERAEVLRRTAENVCYQDPLQAKALADNLLSSLSQEDRAKDDQVSLAARVAESLAGRDPAAALAWAMQQSAGRPQERSVAAAISTWASTDPMAASRWVAQQPAGSLRDEAARRLARTIVEEDPDSAYRWAMSLADENKRLETVSEVFDTWRNQGAQGRQAAWAALQSAALPVEQKTKMARRMGFTQ